MRASADRGQLPAARAYSLRRVGIAASVAVIATMFFSTLGLLSPISGWVAAARARDIADPQPLPDKTAALTEFVLSVPTLLCYLTAIPLVIIWFYRARKNLDAEAFAGFHSDRAAGWAIGGWFVPFADLVIPCRVMAEIARGSLARPITPKLVGVWWAGWVVYSYGDQLLSRYHRWRYDELPDGPTTPAEHQQYVDYYAVASVGSVVTTLCGIVATVALVLLIRRISAAQTVRIHAGRPADPVPPGMAMPVTPATGAGGGTIGA